MGAQDVAAGRVLLVVNFTLDAAYRNRHLLAELYAGRFDGMLFSVSRTCVPDPAYANCVQSWVPPWMRWPTNWISPGCGPTGGRAASSNRPRANSNRTCSEGHSSGTVSHLPSQPFRGS